MRRRLMFVVFGRSEVVIPLWKITAPVVLSTRGAEMPHALNAM